MGSRSISGKNAQSLVSLVERAWGVAEKQVFREFPQKNFPARLSEVLGDFHSYDFPSRNDIFGLQKTLARGVATSRAKAALKKLAADERSRKLHALFLKIAAALQPFSWRRQHPTSFFLRKQHRLLKS